MARVTGGRKLKEFLRKTRAAMSRKPHTIAVGFLDKRIAVLAGRLEFGDPKTNLPERPAFRQGVAELRLALPAIYADVLRGTQRDGIGMSHAQAVEIGKRCRDVLRESYERFEGPGLSERQERRKAGTAGAGKELIGHRGPKLIGHLEVEVDGKTV